MSFANSGNVSRIRWDLKWHVYIDLEQGAHLLMFTQALYKPRQLLQLYMCLYCKHAPTIVPLLRLTEERP